MKRIFLAISLILVGFLGQTQNITIGQSNGLYTVSSDTVCISNDSVSISTNLISPIPTFALSINADGISIPYSGTLSQISSLTYRVVDSISVRVGVSGINDTMLTLYRCSVNTSTNDITGANFNVFPNPTTDLITVSTELTPKLIEVINITGQLVNTVKPTSNQTRIDFTSLPTGVYFIRVDEKTIRKISKI